MNFDYLMHYDLMTGVYVYPVYFDFALLTWTLLTTLLNSIREKVKIHSVETVSEVSQKSSVQIVTYVKRKTCSKSKANLKT